MLPGLCAGTGGLGNGTHMGGLWTLSAPTTSATTRAGCTATATGAETPGKFLMASISLAIRSCCYTTVFDCCATVATSSLISSPDILNFYCKLMRY